MLHHAYPTDPEYFCLEIDPFMRTNIVETFHGTMNECFSAVVENMLGAQVKEEVFRLLGRHGIPHTEISTRFDDVVKVLTEAFGSSARVLIYKTVVEMYSEYSLRANVTFYDSLRDQLDLLKERVVADLLKPRHLLSPESYPVPSALPHK